MTVEMKASKTYYIYIYNLLYIYITLTQIYISRRENSQIMDSKLCKIILIQMIFEAENSCSLFTL